MSATTAASPKLSDASSTFEFNLEKTLPVNGCKAALRFSSVSAQRLKIQDQPVYSLPGELVRAAIPANIDRRIELVRDVGDRLSKSQDAVEIISDGGHWLTVAKIDMSNIIRKKTIVAEARMSASLGPPTYVFCDSSSGSSAISMEFLSDAREDAIDPLAFRSSNSIV